MQHTARRHKKNNNAYYIKKHQAKPAERHNARQWHGKLQHHQYNQQHQVNYKKAFNKMRNHLFVVQYFFNGNIHGANNAKHTKNKFKKESELKDFI